MLVRITPALGYAHGHIETLLIQMGLTVPPRRPDGVVEIEMSEAQIERFQLRGNAHKLERIATGEITSMWPVEAPPPPAPVAPPAAESLFVSLACPACGNDFNLVKALAPNGSVETNCAKCGANLTIEHFAIVDCNPRVPDALKRT